MQSELGKQTQQFGDINSDLPRENVAATTTAIESKNSMVPSTELREQDVQSKECDTKTSQLIPDDQNSDVQKTPIKTDDSFDYQKFPSESEVSI